MTLPPGPGKAAPTPGSAHSKNVLLFSSATFFYWAALYLYSPILSVYARSLGSSLSMVGLIVASYAIPQFVLRIPLGFAYDYMRRRRPFITVGLMLTGLGALGLALAPNPWTLFGARFVTGIGASAWVAFTIYFAGYYPASAAPKAIATINFVQGIALVAATYSGGLVAQHFGYDTTFVIAAILGMAALGFNFAAKEVVPVAVQRIKTKDLVSLVRSRPLLLVSVMGLFAQYVNWAGLFGFTPIYASRLGASSSDLGLMTMLCLATSALASLATTRATKIAGSKATVSLGAILLGGTTALIPAIHTVGGLMWLLAANGLARGLLQTILMSLSVQSVPESHRATAMGVYQAIYAVGMLAGPLVTGRLADAIGLAPAFYVAAGGCAVILALALLPTSQRPR
jgi:MFS family permease